MMQNSCMGPSQDGPPQEQGCTSSVNIDPHWASKQKYEIFNKLTALTAEPESDKANTNI